MRATKSLVLTLTGLAVTTACVPDAADEGSAKAVTTSAATSPIAALAGTSGTITTLATYGGGGRHPGVNAIDIGAPGGSPVHHQLDYLGPELAGGWVRADEVREAGFCSQWAPGSPYHNGAKVIVYTYFFDVGGAFAGWHRAAYQHVSPAPEVLGRWWRWNNPLSVRPAWADPEFTLGDGEQGGLRVGEVFGVRAPVTNGPGGGLCTDGSHLHQEGDGARAPQRRTGEAVRARYSDLHLFTAAGGPGPAGEPPYPPLGATPVEEPSAPPPADPCGGLGYAGACAAGVLTWCEGGAPRSFDCVAVGRGCGYQSDAVGNNCIPGCGDLDYAGVCSGSVLRWCDAGRAKSHDCASSGLTCGWQDEATGHNCVR